MVALCFVLGVVVAQETSALLKDARNSIGFVPYTPQQRQQVASSVNNLLSIYVHRSEKVQAYSREFPQMDPIPRANAIAQQAAQLSDKDFHYQYAELFLSLRDFQ